MKINNKKRHQQRQMLDLRLSPSPPPAPKNGWIKSVRMGLGIPLRTLADMMSVTQNSINQLETSELKKSITLEKLSKVAEAMDCELVYMFKPKSPNQSFDEILEKKSLDYAKRISQGVIHSMALEQQSVDDKVNQNQIKNLAQELKQKLDPRIWESQIIKRKKKEK